MCINKKVVAGLVVAAVAVYLLAPNAFGPVVPVLVFLACPLSMLFMMRMMSRSGNAGTDTNSSSAQSDDELAQLRADVDRLRAAENSSASAASEPPHQR
ncbi:MAG TPA: DUF2933 domain-containing protein [Acidimicrobiales bacterium]|nr:DUF2933 domain-containing protein [Acidimicrobiales bacterium]